MSAPLPTSELPSASRGTHSLHSVVLGLRELENRVAKLEGKPSGYICTGCGQQRPGNWYLYTAYNSETKEEVRGLCAHCIRGGYSRVCGPPWKHGGPYPQNGPDQGRRASDSKTL